MFGLQITVGSVVFYPVALRLTIQVPKEKVTKRKPHAHQFAFATYAAGGYVVAIRSCRQPVLGVPADFTAREMRGRRPSSVTASVCRDGCEL